MKEKIIIESKNQGSNIPAIALLASALLLFIIGNTIEDSPIDFLEGLFEEYLVFFILISLCIIGAIISYLWLKDCKLVVTDKRIYGKAGFGRSVNLPIDMISATSTGMFQSLSVSTSSGRITFYCLGNLEELNSVITDQLFHRLESPKSNDSSVGKADELKKYKNLLDEGIITQEEFDAKKKQMLEM